MADEFVAIGKITAPHGIRGEVKVLPLTDFPERFQAKQTVLLDGKQELIIESAKSHKQFVLLKFRGLSTMNDVEPLRGKLLKVHERDLVKLPEGHYYHFQLIGLEVFDIAGEYIGKITEILETGSNDVYVTQPASGRPILIPALRKVVKTVDLENGKMIVEMLEWEEE